MKVINAGSAAIAGVTVGDDLLTNETPVLSGGFNVGDTDTDGLLDVNETWTFGGTHQVTQTDLDAGGAIVNTATASGTGATSVDDTASVTVTQSKALHIEKDATETFVDSTDDVIHYTMKVSNAGSAAIAGVTVQDDLLTNEAPKLSGGFNTCPTRRDSVLDVNETWTFSGTHQVTQTDLDAGGAIVN